MDPSSPSRTPVSKPIRVLSPTLMTLILAACGGGGGGGGPVTAAPQSGGGRPVHPKFDVNENARHITHLFEGNDSIMIGRFDTGSKVTNGTVTNVEISADGGTVTVTYGEGGESTHVAYTITGPDALYMKFEKKGQTDASLVFRYAPDYEAPDDVTENNQYEIDFNAKVVKPPETSVVDTVHLVTPKMTITVRNLADGRTETVYARQTGDNAKNILDTAGYVREGDHIRISIVEDKQALFSFPIIKNTQTDIPPVRLQGKNWLSGADAGAFEIVRQENRQTDDPQLVIRFKTPPDYERPGSADGDNVYHFDLDDFFEDYWGDLTFEVTVIDNPFL